MRLIRRWLGGWLRPPDLLAHSRREAMRKLLAKSAPLVLAGLLCGAARAGETERLISIKYDLLLNRVCAEFAIGDYKDGEFQFARLGAQYCIDPINLTVSNAEATRKFDGEDGGVREAKALRDILTTLARYCNDTAAWWRDGRGEPVSKPRAQVKSGRIHDDSVGR